MDGSTRTISVRIEKIGLDALGLFQRALPAEFFAQQRRAAGQPPEKGIYTAAVVVLLFIQQRLLQDKGTLSGAVRQLLSGQLERLLPRHKRIEEGSLSGNTGAYSRARSRLPYNLVRAAIYAAAQAANLNPRQISFSRAQDVVNACLPNLLAARSEHEHAIQLDAMLRRIAQCKLPRTSHRPSYPRMVWPRGVAFPKRKSGEHHAPKNSHD